jgi:hypothetical protein
MAKIPKWDYALRIRGTTPQGIPLAKLAEYLKEFANLLGEAQRPVFGGIVKGSALLRSAVPPDANPTVRLRLVEAKLDPETNPGRHAGNIEKLMERDNTRGQVEDRNGAVILEFSPKKKTAEVQKEYFIQDTGIIDGIVVSIAGVDDTVHIKLQATTGGTQSVVLRDIEMARQLAHHFRADPIRMYVHGSWKRTAKGNWEPNMLYVDRFEELDDRSAKEVLQQLAELPGNKWASMSDPSAFLKELRGAD